MEPITHFMTGAALARSAMPLPAEAPDLDTLWAIRGPIASFQHHRGWTHTFIGLPFEAAVIVGFVWLLHRWRLRGKDPHPGKPAAPIRWGLLYCFSLIALLSHLLLDWTNTYGIRSFFPFDPHWYAGSIVFIFEPVIFILLLTALIAPSLFGLINSEVGARKPAFPGRGWAIFALLAIVALWAFRFIEHAKALQLAQTTDYNAAPVSRVFASPFPTNPFHWETIAETPQFYQLASVDTLNNQANTRTQPYVFYKPPTPLATLVAKRSWLGEAYLDWSQYPIVTDTGTNEEGLTTVTFRDLRFFYDTPFLSGREDPPLSGAVFLNADRRIVRMELGNRIQH